MKSERNPGQNPKSSTGRKTESEKSPATKKTAETITKDREVWKNPDPTKPEKQKGPYSEKGPARTNVPTPVTDKKKKPEHTESKDDEDIGSLDEQDIDDLGISGEADDDRDFMNEDDIRSA